MASIYREITRENSQDLIGDIGYRKTSPRLPHPAHFNRPKA